MIDNKKLTAKLRDIGCPETQIPEITNKAGHFLPDAANMLREWLDQGTITEYSLYGITPKYLREDRSMTDIGIIISYDWLLHEGETAAAALREPLR